MDTNTKKCKFCQKDISETAKRCPNCSGDLRIWFARHKILTGLGILILVPIVLSNMSSYIDKAKTVNSDIETAKNTRTPQQIAVDEVALKMMKKEYDEMRKVTFYSDPSSPETNNTKNIRLYIAKSDTGNPMLRFYVSYAGSDWLFIRNYIINVDGQTYKITPSKVERDNTSTIWEWSDEAITSDELGVAKAIANSKDAKIRYDGQQYYSDRNITNNEKIAIQNVLFAFEELTYENK